MHVYIPLFANVHTHMHTAIFLVWSVFRDANLWNISSSLEKLNFFYILYIITWGL